MSEKPAALLVIDLQTAMFAGREIPPIFEADRLAGVVRDLVAGGRQTGAPIAFIRHDGDPPGHPLAPGAPGWPIWPDLGQSERDPVFAKTVGDAFSNPELGAWIRNSGCGRVILCGAQSDFCVAATLSGAFEAGLEVVVVSDAHSTWDSGGRTAPEIIVTQNALFENQGARLVTSAVVIGEFGDRS